MPDPPIGTYCSIDAHHICPLSAAKCGCHCHQETLMARTATDSTSIACEHCGRVCGSSTGLASHIRAMHPDAAPPSTSSTLVNPPRSARPDPDSDFAWEDPPPGGRGGRYVQLVAEFIPVLRREAGRWARLVVFEGENQANSAKTTLGKHEPYADIEWAARKTPDGRSALYARFKGDDDA